MQLQVPVLAPVSNSGHRVFSCHPGATEFKSRASGLQLGTTRFELLTGSHTDTCNRVYMLPHGMTVAESFWVATGVKDSIMPTIKLALNENCFP